MRNGMIAANKTTDPIISANNNFDLPFLLINIIDNTKTPITIMASPTVIAYPIKPSPLKTVLIF